MSKELLPPCKLELGGYSEAVGGKPEIGEIGEKMPKGVTGNCIIA